MSNGKYLSPLLSRKLLEKAPQVFGNKKDEVILSPQQIRVLKLMRYGYTNQEIAEKLFLSKRTVDMHAYKIFKRLHVNNRIQALQEGLNMAVWMIYREKIGNFFMCYWC